jgi:hypothetical protein
MFAAVVSHFVLSHVFIIVHAHINQIHVTTWAAILPGSPLIYHGRSATSIERTMRRVDQRHMSMCVLSHAGWLFNSRSNHITDANIRLRISFMNSSILYYFMSYIGYCTISHKKKRKNTVIFLTKIPFLI